MGPPATASRPRRLATASGSVLARLLCGFDGTEASFEAIRQASLLRARDGRLLCVTVCDSRWSPLPEEAARGLAGLERLYGSPDWLETRFVEGARAPMLALLAARLKADAVAVGAPRGGWMRGIVGGSVATELLHAAPCPVLVARPWPSGRPRRVVVGVGGSVSARAALARARALAATLEVELLPLVAGGADDPAPGALAVADDLEFVSGEPVGALVAATDPDDLLVVGSRGRRGVAALASVSERVAHEASCSVLVVRPTARPRRPRAAGGPASTVRDVMRDGVVTVPGEQSLAEVAALLLAGDADVVAVTDPEGRPCGLLSESELPAVADVRIGGTSLVWPHYRGEPVWSDAELAGLVGAAAARPAAEIVRRPPVTLREDDTALHAAELLARHGVSHLPVLRGRRLVGTVSRRDLLRLSAGGAPARHPRP